MRLLIILVSLGVVRCNAGHDCEPGDRHGSYYVEFHRASGTCAHLSDKIEKFGWETPAECATIRSTEWSEDSCTLTTGIRCGNQQTGDVVEVAQTSTQLDDDGDELEGVRDVSLYNAAGGAVCYASYEFHAERQD